MQKQFSEISIRLSRPVIEEIFAWLEFHLIKYPDLDRHDRFLTIKIEPRWSSADLNQAMTIIGTWLDPKLFKTNYVEIVKLSPEAKWNDVYKTLQKKLKIYGAEKFISIKDGYLYAKDKYIDFPNPNEDYVLVAKFLIQSKEPLCTYKILKSEFGKKEKSEIKTIKKIHNALATLYRNRKKQKVSFPKVAPDGRKIFEIEDGVGIQVYNPDL